MTDFVKYYILKNNIEKIPYETVYELYNIKLIDIKKALIYASENGNLKIIKYFYKNGVNCNSAVGYAMINGHFNVVKYILDKADYDTFEKITLMNIEIFKKEKFK